MKRNKIYRNNPLLLGMVAIWQSITGVFLDYFVPHNDNLLSKNQKIKTKNYFAFTLVELIIAIAITTIIATVSFISFQNFFATSKDTIRIEDMKSLKVALSSIKTQNGGYSYPDSYFTIMNSGTTNEEVYQGFINSNITLNNIPQIPKDPQTSNYYILSTTKTKQQYQIAMTLENNGTNKAFVDGDYYSNTISIFPSIILAYSGTSAQEIASGVITNGSTGSINRMKFILNGSKLNLPYSLTTKNIIQTATSYNQITQEPGINLDRNTDYYACKDMYDDKKYLGPGYYDLIDSTSGLYVSTYCDGVVVSTEITLSYFPGEDGISGNSDDCNTPNIVLSNGQEWSACNLGAKIAFTPASPNSGAFSGSSSSIRGGDDNVNGNLYQWGRNKGFSSSDTSQLATQINSANPNLSDSFNFVWNGTLANNDWLQTQSGTLWGGSTSDSGTNDGQTDDSLRKGPCPSGWHVPSAKDWQDACNSIMGITCTGSVTDTTGKIRTALLLPYVGTRAWGNGLYYYQDTYGFYLSSSPSTTNAFLLSFNSSAVRPICADGRAMGFAVRCLKND